jgi:hypothetical protein
MGCDTKGIVATNKKDVREIANALLRVIHEIPVTPKDTDVIPKKSNWVECVNYNPGSDYFRVNFRDGVDDRTLWVFLDCDDRDVCDSKILLSFGMWGNSESLMKKFLKALEHLGDTYFILNDCGDKGWEKLS